MNQFAEGPDTRSNPRPSPTVVLICFLAVLFLVAATWFGILYVRGVSKDSLDMEFAKALLQVGVVSVMAAVLSILVFGHQHRMHRNERESERRTELQRQSSEAVANQLRYRDELLKSTLTRITAAYNSTKRARRRMRATGRRIGARTDVYHAAYDELMVELSDAQLELETIKSDVKTSQPAYPSANTLAPALRTMEKYLGELIEEYETLRSSADPRVPVSNLDDLPRLKDFLGSSAGSKFASRFSDTHATARAAIRGDLLHQALPGIDYQNTTAM